MTAIRELSSYAARIRKLSKQITHADLTEAVAGTAQDIALGSLPAGAVLVSEPAVKLTTQFTGGSASAVGMTVGTAAAPTLVMTSFDAFGATASGLFVRGTRGAQQQVPSGGQAIVARFTPDGAHTLLALTAGDLVVEVYYALPDASTATP
jgi:hypothetical protein